MKQDSPGYRSNARFLPQQITPQKRGSAQTETIGLGLCMACTVRIPNRTPQENAADRFHDSPRIYRKLERLAGPVLEVDK